MNRTIRFPWSMTWAWLALAPACVSEDAETETPSTADTQSTSSSTSNDTSSSDTSSSDTSSSDTSSSGASSNDTSTHGSSDSDDHTTDSRSGSSGTSDSGTTSGDTSSSDGAVTEECPAPSGSAIDVAALDSPGSLSGAYECFGDVEPTLLTSQAELEDFFTLCEIESPDSLPEPDFTTQHVFAAVVPDRPSVSLEYAVDVGANLELGVRAEAYCGGARPPAGVVLVAFDITALPVTQHTCFVGECTGLPPP